MHAKHLYEITTAITAPGPHLSDKSVPDAPMNAHAQRQVLQPSGEIVVIFSRQRIQSDILPSHDIRNWFIWTI